MCHSLFKIRINSRRPLALPFFHLAGAYNTGPLKGLVPWRGKFFSLTQGEVKKLLPPSLGNGGFIPLNDSRCECTYRSLFSGAVLGGVTDSRTFTAFISS